MDGFVPSRHQRSALDSVSSHNSRTTIGHSNRLRGEQIEMHSGDKPKARLGGFAPGESLKNGISSSLEAIDQSKPQTPRQLRKKDRKKKRKIKFVSMIIGVILLILIGFIVYKALGMLGNVLNGNPFDLFSQQPLKEDKY